MTGIIGAMEEEVAALKEAMEVQEAAERVAPLFEKLVTESIGAIGKSLKEKK